MCRSQVGYGVFVKGRFEKNAFLCPEPSNPNFVRSTTCSNNHANRRIHRRARWKKVEKAVGPLAFGSRVILCLRARTRPTQGHQRPLNGPICLQRGVADMASNACIAEGCSAMGPPGSARGGQDALFNLSCAVAQPQGLSAKFKRGPEHALRRGSQRVQNSHTNADFTGRCSATRSFQW